MNLVCMLPLKSASGLNKYISKKEDRLANLTLNDLDFQCLTAALARTGLLSGILRRALQSDSPDNLIRAAMKLLISLAFKTQNQRVFLGEPLQAQAHVTANTESLFAKLNISLDDEKRLNQDLLKQFLKKLHHFELAKIHKGSYVQYIHLISQVLLQTTTPTDKRDERLYLLPTRTMAVEILQTFIDSMDPSVPDSINKALDAPNSPEGDKKRKQMLFKFFYFNYTFQIIA